MKKMRLNVLQRMPGFKGANQSALKNVVSRVVARDTVATAFGAPKPSASPGKSLQLAAAAGDGAGAGGGGGTGRAASGGAGDDVDELVANLFVDAPPAAHGAPHHLVGAAGRRRTINDSGPRTRGAIRQSMRRVSTVGGGAGGVGGASLPQRPGATAVSPLPTIVGGGDTPASP